MKLSLASLLLFALPSAHAGDFLDSIFGGDDAEEDVAAVSAVLYNRQDDCFIKVDGPVALFGDYNVNNDSVNPGLVCVNGICNVGQNIGAIGLPLSQINDDDDSIRFTQLVKMECTDKENWDFLFSCPGFRDTVTMEVISCTSPGVVDCGAQVRQKIAGGTVEVDRIKDMDNDDESVLVVKFTCTDPTN